MNFLLFIFLVELSDLCDWCHTPFRTLLSRSLDLDRFLSWYSIIIFILNIHIRIGVIIITNKVIYLYKSNKYYINIIHIPTGGTISYQILLSFVLVKYIFIMSSLFQIFFYFYNHLILLIPWFTFNINYITWFSIE